MTESSDADKSPAIECLQPGSVAVADVGDNFPKYGAVGAKIREGEELKIGDSIMHRSNGTWKNRVVNSIQLNHVPIETAIPGEPVGIHIGEEVDEGTVIYRLLREESSESGCST